MKKLLFLLNLFFFACNFSTPTSVKNNNITSEEKVFLGLEPSAIYENNVNIKIASENDFTSCLRYLEKKGCVINSVKDGIRKDEKYVHAKIIENYAQTLSEIRKMKGVVFAEPDYLIKIWPKKNIAFNTENIESKNINDPIFNDEGYSLQITKALKAYKEVGYGQKTVWAGIIDTGTNANHEDLILEDGTKLVKILKSAFSEDGTQSSTFNEVTSGNSDTDEGSLGHGTHCSGIIAAVGNNGKGISGVAWKNLNLISYKALYNGSGSEQTIYSALRDLTDEIRTLVPISEQATIPVNLSLGGGHAGQFALEMINYALSKGVLPIVAMGNEAQILPSYPAAFPGVLSVGSTDGKDKKSNFSTGGAWINLVAPGDKIISLMNNKNDGYVYMSGTSMATPFITGVISYLLSFAPNLTPYQIIALLEKTADKIDSTYYYEQYDKNGFSLWYGYGRVNVYEATKLLKDGKISEVGKKYIEKILTIEVPDKEMIHIYSEKTGVLITMVMAKEGKNTNGKLEAEVRGLQEGKYEIVYKESMKTISINNETNVKVEF